MTEVVYVNDTQESVVLNDTTGDEVVIETVPSYGRFTSTADGLVPASGGSGLTYLRDDGTWVTPAGGAGGVADGDKGDVVVSDGGTVWSLDYTIINATVAPTWARVTGRPTTLAGYGITDPVAARTTLERQDFATRSDFVTWATGRTPAVGLVMRAGGQVYRYLGTGTAISDLPGWVPDFAVHLLHWGADPTGTTTCSTRVKQAVNYVASLGGGSIDTSGGIWRCDTQINVDVGQDNVALVGNGVFRKGTNTANNLLRVYGAYFSLDGPTIDGQKAVNTTDTTLLFVYGADARVRNSRLTGSAKNGIATGYDATSGLTTTRLMVTNTLFDSNDGVGLSNAGVIGLTCIGNTFRLNGLEGLTLDQGASQVKVVSNHFENNNQGSLEGGFGIGQIGYDGVSTAVIADNTFKGTGTRSGVRMGNATGTSTGVTITGNSFDGQSIAIDLSGTTSTTAGDTGTVISGNVAKNCTTMIAYDGRSTVKVGTNLAGPSVTYYVNTELAVAGTYLTEHPSFSSLTELPTTLAGYGIVNAMPLTADLTYMPLSGFKQPARLLSTTNIDITTGGTAAVDGITTTLGDRVLLVGQTTASQNGLYTVNAGSWTRVTDANTSNQLAAALVVVERGPNGGTRWATTWKRGNVLDTASMSWYKILDTSSVSSSAVDLTTAQTVAGKKTFTSELGFTALSSDPASPANGDQWLSPDGRLKARESGVTSPVFGQKILPFMVPPSGTYIHTLPLGGTNTYGSPSATADQFNMYAHIFGIDFTCDQVLLNIATAVVGGLAKVAIYDSDAQGRPANKLFETGDIDGSVTGDRFVAQAYNFVAGKTYWIGTRTNSSSLLIYGVARQPIQGLTTGLTSNNQNRNLLRRTITYATPAPASWGFSNAEGASQAATNMVYFRVA